MDIVKEMYNFSYVNRHNVVAITTSCNTKARAEFKKLYDDHGKY